MTVLTRLVIFILLLHSSIQAFTGLSTPPKSIHDELSENGLYLAGVTAMNDKLPRIAVNKFRLVLADENLSKKLEPYAQLALSEALIHTNALEKNMTEPAQEALKILDTDKIKTLSSAPILKAEALAALHRYQDASESLFTVKSDHPLYDEVLISRARLLIAMKRYDGALSALNLASQSKSKALQNTAYLLLVEVHLKRNNLDSAATALKKINVSENTKLFSSKLYLEAQLSLKQVDITDAVSLFESILAEPKHLPKSLYHASFLGLADAQLKNKDEQAAITTLLNFISEHNSSTFLAEAFTKLSKLLTVEMAPSHPAIAQLNEWSLPEAPKESTIYFDNGQALSIPYRQTNTTQPQNLKTLAIYHRALILSRSTNPQDHWLALSLLNQLRTSYFPKNNKPNALFKELQAISLLDTAYLHILLKQRKLAAHTLSLMGSFTSSSALKDQANIVRGLLLDEEAQPEASLKAFIAARESTSEQVTSIADINAGIMALKASKLETFQNILETTQQKEIRTVLLLEQALWKASQRDIESRDSLETFIINHPGHKREFEVRLALAEACIDIEPYDTLLAKSQIEIISPLLPEVDDQYRITRVSIKTEELSDNWIAAAEIAKNFTLKFPDDPRSPALTLKRGAAYFHNEDYNQARLIFTELSSKATNTKLTNYATFYSAMSARLGGTAQSREESILLFQNVIDNGEELAAESRIQQARILIDLRRYSEAESALKPLMKTKDTPPFIHNNAGILLADCLHRQGANHHNKYEEAIEVYKKLLQAKNLSSGKKSRLYFLQGKTYESMGRQKKAFEAYYSVIESKLFPKPSQNTNEEWKWFYQCGFQALFILESEERWETAIKLARNIATHQGPRSEEARKRANNIAKTHMIWEEVDPLLDIVDKIPEPQ